MLQSPGGTQPFTFLTMTPGPSWSASGGGLWPSPLWVMRRTRRSDILFWCLLGSLASSSQSVLGKFVGGFCALVGVFTITLPIPIVVNSFAGFYKNTLMRNEVNSKKRERLKSERHKWRRELQESVTRGGITSEEVNKIIRILSTIFTRYPQLTDLVFAPSVVYFDILIHIQWSHSPRLILGGNWASEESQQRYDGGRHH